MSATVCLNLPIGASRTTVLGTLHTPSGTLSANGNFNWYNRPAYQGTNQPGNTFDGFFGQRNQFEVTPAMVGQTVTFELGVRECNVAIDGMLFIQTSNIYPDQDVLDLYSQAELDAAVLPPPPVPVAGDYNGNGTVDARRLRGLAQWRSAGE